MALPWVRIFVREDGSPPLSNADNPDNEPEENNYHPQSYAKQRNQTVLSRQADEMVDAMRRACFWGREKGFGEKRVSRAQVSSESWSVCGESSAREWVDERLELAGDGID
ncbi:hypothetical protein BDV29DRAFT_132465 [Aspergillus leporis]|uniref:Uncharacterized protein n=1 Tax=Aspergillus leporis TaxID=41062 RepID=A0A5N5WZD2_9EURO|nr:hypothetical protein BDV29DRAFT_132465 [Aspergillus leporis]